MAFVAWPVRPVYNVKQTMPSSKTDKRSAPDIMAEAAEGKQADQSEMNAIVMRKMTKILPIFMFFITD